MDPLMIIYYDSYIVVINSNIQNVKFNLKSVSFSVYSWNFDYKHVFSYSFLSCDDICLFEL